MCAFECIDCMIRLTDCSGFFSFCSFHFIYIKCVRRIWIIGIGTDIHSTEIFLFLGLYTVSVLFWAARTDIPSFPFTLCQTQNLFIYSFHFKSFWMLIKMLKWIIPKSFHLFFKYSLLLSLKIDWLWFLIYHSIIHFFFVSFPFYFFFFVFFCVFVFVIWE